MGTINDSIGVWNDLGSIIPAPNQWLKFPTTANGGNDCIRLSFFFPPEAVINSWGWIRAIYTTADTAPVSQSVKVYPKLQPMLLDLTIPKDLRDRGIIFRDFEFLKIVRQSYVLKDYDWSVKLEELWG